MRKTILLFITGCIMLISCDKAEKEFDEKLNKADLNISAILIVDAVFHDAISEAWHDAIYKKITPSGKRCLDFNEALEEVLDTMRVHEVDSKVQELNETLLNMASELNPPPSSRKECYDDFVEIVSDVSTLTRAVIEVNGSYKTYTDKAEELFDEISKKRDQFTIKYGKLLKNYDTDNSLNEESDEL